MRRNITAYAVELARSGNSRRKNGVDLEPGEFTTRDAEVAAQAGNHQREKARRLIEALTAEGMLEVTRVVERGRSNPWVIRKATPVLLMVEKVSAWESEVDVEVAFDEAVGREALSRDARVLRRLDRKPVLPAQTRREPGARKQRRAAAEEELLLQARRMYEIPDGVTRRDLNRMLHDVPSWFWHKGELSAAARDWERRKEWMTTAFANGESEHRW